MKRTAVHKLAKVFDFCITLSPLFARHGSGWLYTQQQKKRENVLFKIDWLNSTYFIFSQFKSNKF